MGRGAGEIPCGPQRYGGCRKKEKFGWFILLEPGVTGLLPISKIDQATDPKAYDHVKPGSSLMVVIDAVDSQNRKVTLAPGLGDAVGEWQNTRVLHPRP
ncbi:MAG: S1 RNA-binding domain-containing protein [Deltaproteobacteria bacterium]|nr:S1 RNA-binding domain-containing protein [Deltaproteobacteria bacterium]